jgi:hypothetical protein
VRRCGVGASAVACGVASLWGGFGLRVCRCGLDVRLALLAHARGRSQSPFPRGGGQQRGRAASGAAWGDRQLPSFASSSLHRRRGLGSVAGWLVPGQRPSSTSPLRRSRRRDGVAIGQTLARSRSCPTWQAWGAGGDGRGRAAVRWSTSGLPVLLTPGRRDVARGGRRRCSSALRASGARAARALQLRGRLRQWSMSPRPRPLAALQTPTCTLRQTGTA